MNYMLERKDYLIEKAQEMMSEDKQEMTWTLINIIKEDAHESGKKGDKLEQELLEPMLKREGVTEELKGQNQLLWVGMYNNCLHSVQEIVLEQVVYQKPLPFDQKMIDELTVDMLPFG